MQSIAKIKLSTGTLNKQTKNHCSKIACFKYLDIFFSFKSKKQKKWQDQKSKRHCSEKCESCLLFNVLFKGFYIFTQIHECLIFKSLLAARLEEGGVLEVNVLILRRIDKTITDRSMGF